jgi:hypothetical protein
MNGIVGLGQKTGGGMNLNPLSVGREKKKRKREEKRTM